MFGCKIYIQIIWTIGYNNENCMQNGNLKFAYNVKRERKTTWLLIKFANSRSSVWESKL